jgi:hypothetical protein
MTTPKQITSDPQLFADKFLKVMDKNKNLVPLKWNKAQAHFHANRTGRDLVLKARQLGFSTYTQGEMFRRKVTGARTTITLAHDDDTTQILRRMETRFWEHCKFGNIQPAREYANARLATYPDYGSESLIATAGSKEKGRGGSYTDFHGSEVAFWKSADRLVAGAMQGGRADVILESTPNGAQGYFYERCMEALRGDGVWTLHFYPWWWDDEYRLPLEGDIVYTDEERALVDLHGLSKEQINWRRYKKKELRGLFLQEYPEDATTCFITSGNSYFGDLSDVFTAPLGATYNKDHNYVAGLDFGQTNDYTAMPVIDMTANVQVDLLHIRKLSWAEQRRRIAEMSRKWHCSSVCAEMNSIGSVNIEALMADGVPITPFTTTNKSKARIMSSLYEGIHTDRLRLLDIPAQKHEMYTFVSSQTQTGAWRLAADGNGHDDTVISLALAWYAAASPAEYIDDPFAELYSDW